MMATAPVALLLGVALAGFVGCQQSRWQIDGRAMGTTYSVVIEDAARGAIGRSEAQRLVATELGRLNATFSTYLDSSEISRFNQAGPQLFAASEDFLRVTRWALEISELTGGAYDPTVGPLVELWGFGRKKTHSRPNPALLRTARARVGFRHINVNENDGLRRTKAGIELDLNGIVKGYAADQVSQLLAKQGFVNVLVEVGGEIRVRSHNRTAPWKVGVEAPNYENKEKRVHRVLLVRNGAVATSGDYRNFFVSGSNRLSHILDPRTGEPVRARVISATVVGPECTTADGLATALIVLGPKEGLNTMAHFAGYDALLLIEKNGGGFEEKMTAGMSRYFTK